MRHRKAGRKLNRSSAHRQALMRNMVTYLIAHERVQTTDAKAKAVRPWSDLMITLGRSGSLPARPRASAFIRCHYVLTKLFA